MNDGTVQVRVDGNGIANITLNRPEVHNAFDDNVIARLTRELRSLSEDDDVRVVVLGARGKSFCAGADVNWMTRMAEFSEAENLADASSLAELLYTLDSLAKPTIALVQGAAMGGGVGLICACDIAIATQSAFFAISEVRLGLIPSVISPFVINAIGESRSRRYFLTGERISAQEAQRIGLVHDVVPDEALAVRGETFINMLLEGGPKAQTESKALISAVHGKPIDQSMAVDLAKRIARVRVSEEGQEGMAAFKGKRKPEWPE